MKQLGFYHPDDDYLPRDTRRRVCGPCYGKDRQVKVKHLTAQGEQRTRAGTVLSLNVCEAVLHQAIAMIVELVGMPADSNATLPAVRVDEEFFFNLLRRGFNSVSAQKILIHVFLRVGGLQLATPLYTHATKSMMLDFFELVRHDDRATLYSKYNFLADESNLRLVSIRTACCCFNGILSADWQNYTLFASV